MLRVLLVEDSPGDVRLVREALKDAAVDISLTVAKDGVEAMDYLYRSVEGSVPRPGLVLLDLNLPRKSGREVLAEVKSDRRLRRIPILIMSSSCDEEDIAFAYDLNANSYLSKPVDLSGYMRLVRAIEGFWFSATTLPNEIDTPLTGEHFLAGHGSRPRQSVR